MLCVECFGGLAPCPSEGSPENGYHYKKYVNELNLDGIEFPMKVSQRNLNGKTRLKVLTSLVMNKKPLSCIYYEREKRKSRQLTSPGK